MPWCSKISTVLTLAFVGLTSLAHADTFGGQLHGVRAKGALDGADIESTGDRDARLPSSLELDGDGSLIGADFRFDWMFDDLRLGAGLMVFGVREMHLASPRVGQDLAISVGDGFGGSLEWLIGYELMQGPVYLYADVRTVLQGFEAPVAVLDEVTGEESSYDYGRWSVGMGPRLGMLVPVGHSLMIDLAMYQRVIGGLEETTAFVGLGYWENDRTDPFTDELKGSFGGDF